MFYKETTFEKTPIGKFPKDWKTVTLGQIANVKGGKRLPKGEKLVEFNTGFPYIRVVDFKNGIVDVSEVKYLLPETYEKIKNYTISSNDVYISIAGTIGLAGLVPPELDGANLTENAAKLCDLKGVKKEFLAYLLNSKVLKEQIIGLMGKGTQPKLALFRIKSLRLVLPYLKEQERIAEVLGVVDSVIAKTGEVIAKTERLKKGLMQTLLTRGIGHKEYKQTPIGTIPKTWQIVKLEEVVLEAKSGFASGKRDENGILQLRMDNIETEGWINPEAGVKVPIPPDVEEYLLKPNDILFNNTNSVDLIGKTAIFRGELTKCVYSNHLTRIRVNTDRVILEWILFVLIRKWQTGVFKAICHRHVHQAGINNSDLLNIKIPLPEISEQQKIAQILSTTDKKLKIERQEKARLEKIKQGLMDLLLTGKIRVKVD